jgi:hypothetical protein
MMTVSNQRNHDLPGGSTRVLQHNQGEGGQLSTESSIARPRDAVMSMTKIDIAALEAAFNAG